MERLTQQAAVARKALQTLDEVADQAEPSAIIRDAAIQRFEYSFEATWKAVQRYLEIHEGLQAGSPKGVFRGAFQAGLLNEDQSRTALAMVDDRNLTTHTYNEELAVRIYGNLGQYHQLMTACINAVAE